jgi:hypothetical protein
MKSVNELSCPDNQEQENFLGRNTKFELSTRGNPGFDTKIEGTTHFKAIHPSNYENENPFGHFN